MEGIELGGDQQFCLRWNNFQANITSQFEALRDDEDFVDVTLACEGHRLEAHKVVLSACSPYFKELFKNNPCPHPIIFMRDCELAHVTALLEFMYAGEVNIAQAQLASFLRTAEALQIRGLTDSASKGRPDTKPPNAKPPPSQLRNLLSAKSSNSTSSKAVSQTNESLHNDISDKTASVQGLTNSRDDDDKELPVGLQASCTDETLFPSSSQLRPNNEFSEKNNYGAVRLKCDLALMERKNEDYENKVSDNVANACENDVQKVGKINPFAVSNTTFGGLHTDPEAMSNMLEPKMEMSDYNSDEEMKQERTTFNSEMFFDANNPLANPFQSLQGTVEYIAGLNQDFREDTVEGARGGRVRCVRCGRRYSNVSNLRQHVRLIHESQPAACPACGRCFKTPLYLRRHMLSQHADSYPALLRKMQGKTATLIPIRSGRPAPESRRASSPPRAVLNKVLLARETQVDADADIELVTVDSLDEQEESGVNGEREPSPTAPAVICRVNVTTAIEDAMK